MFDVIWTDPNRELVGEHRAKKEKKRGQKEKDRKRSSLSTKRGSLSSADSPFSFLRSHSLKFINTSDANSKSRSTPSSRLASPSLSSTRPPLSATFDAKGRRNSGHAATCSSDVPAPGGKPSTDRIASSEDDQSPGLSRHDSIFSKYADSDVGTNQSIGEVSVSDHGRSAQSQVSQTARGDPVTSCPAPSNKFPAGQSSHMASHVPCSSATRPRPSSRLIRPTNNPGPSDSVVLVPGPLSPTRGPRHFQLNNPDSWRASDQWTSTFESKGQTLDTLAEMLSRCNASSQSVASPLDIGFWELEIQKMSSIGLNEVVSRLKLICGSGSDEDSCPIDETESMRWMLWSLTDLDPTPAHDTSVQSAPNIWRNNPDKVLVLHESQDITSYLTAFYSKSQVYHISTTPVPPSFSSNIHPISVASSHPSCFPPACPQYDTVISLSLPSLLPAVDIPPTLAQINNCLRPGGTLRLLLIDPLPRAGTLGRHMTSWLRDHLLANLERSFRCASPSRLFPDWLADASLRGDGSTITKTRFFANPASVKLHAASTFVPDEPVDPCFKAAQEQRVAKAEARSLAGRLLWKHIWGPFVTGDKWWWDDPVCVHECLELGTVWEYQLVEGVKSGPAT